MVVFLDRMTTVITTAEPSTSTATPTKPRVIFSLSENISAAPPELSDPDPVPSDSPFPTPFRDASSRHMPFGSVKPEKKKQSDHVEESETVKFLFPPYNPTPKISLNVI